MNSVKTYHAVVVRSAITAIAELLVIFYYRYFFPCDIIGRQLRSELLSSLFCCCCCVVVVVVVDNDAVPAADAGVNKGGQFVTTAIYFTYHVKYIAVI